MFSGFGFSQRVRTKTGFSVAHDIRLVKNLLSHGPLHCKAPKLDRTGTYRGRGRESVSHQANIVERLRNTFPPGTAGLRKTSRQRPLGHLGQYVALDKTKPGISGDTHRSASSPHRLANVRRTIKKTGPEPRFIKRQHGRVCHPPRSWGPSWPAGILRQLFSVLPAFSSPRVLAPSCQSASDAPVAPHGPPG